MRQFLFLLLFLSSLHLASPAWGIDLYVNNKLGNDNNDGRSARATAKGTGPVRTIQRALKLCRKGDRVNLAKTDEPYRESISVQGGRNAGVDGIPFVILGNGAVLDGSAVIPDSAWEHFDGQVFRYRPRRLQHHMLFIDGVPAEKVRTKGPGLPQLEPRQWCLVDGYVYFKVEQNNLPTAYKLTHSLLPVGITIYETRYLRIENLTVQGYRLDGVNAHDSVFDTTLIGVTARGNGRSGISIGGASRVEVRACLVGNNGTAQIRTEGRSQAKIINTDIVHQENVADIEQAETTIVQRDK